MVSQNARPKSTPTSQPAALFGSDPAENGSPPDATPPAGSAPCDPPDGPPAPPIQTATASPPPDDDPFNPDRLRLSQDFASAVGVRKLLTTVPVRKPSKG